jgi:AraC-like DNA-binding protein
MINLHGTILSDPRYYRQLRCRDTLISLYNCPLENKFEDIWSRYNYIVYVIEGRKIWHTAHGSYDLRTGSCVFVRKGAAVVEQFFDTAFCLVMFFVPDEFIIEVLKTKERLLPRGVEKSDPVMLVDPTPSVSAFFHSMMPYFESPQPPDAALLELKFREIILTMADNPRNGALLSYFSSLLNEPKSVDLQRVMEENYSYHLGLEQFAQLCNRSLSAFKRDFQKIYQTTPGKWILEKRLDKALHMLSHMDKTVQETAFETGFENPSHFSRVFRERFGYPPTAVKQKKQA